MLMKTTTTTKTAKDTHKAKKSTKLTRTTTKTAKDTRKAKKSTKLTWPKYRRS